MATATSIPARPPSPSPSQVPLPASPTYSYASTANPLSSYNLPLPPPPRPVHAVLTKSDLEQSQQAYSDLLATAKSYRIALSALSNAASAFGSALESCARLKESRADALGPPGGASLTNSFTTKNTCTADLLLGASGVHHLVANHQQILSETVYRSFEVPLLHELDRWRRAIEDEDETYKREAAARSREIRRLEKEGLKLHRQSRRRDVAKFREHLVALTSKLDGLTALHADHARTLLRDSQETSARILDASCSLVRAEVDIFEGLARKGWTGGGLDDLLEKGQDLFASDDDLPGAVAATTGGVVIGSGVGAGGAGDGGGAKLFSILPPKSILANDASSDSLTARGGGESHGRADSLLVDSDDVQYQSLTGAVDQKDRGREADSQSLFSESNLSQKQRGVRPFSPQPIRRRGTDVVMDPESLLVGGEDELRTDDDDDDDDDERDAATVRGTSAQRTGLGGLRIGADENGIGEAESPWKDEGLRRKDESESATSSSSNDGNELPPPSKGKDEVDDR
ncbi:uncharacterized protein F4807DRAFT_457360 [Annulohypoxylon truncatum]|uniref:uncharacterized protein n=1 Tax=Annulohypoxylon truncatum TaxID=327061 RepID=UPI002007B662|nr:uncharacterized protein F4807DRAFT_457360 [Annulohypoxylon truncatum]KAI1212564.1 hypothetical protein F4807DRAFT_457360 [Annulohypoxylon truncatum]